MCVPESERFTADCYPTEPVMQESWWVADGCDSAWSQVFNLRPQDRIFLQRRAAWGEKVRSATRFPAVGHEQESGQSHHQSINMSQSVREVLPPWALLYLEQNVDISFASSSISTFVLGNIVVPSLPVTWDAFTWSHSECGCSFMLILEMPLWKGWAQWHKLLIPTLRKQRQENMSLRVSLT